MPLPPILRALNARNFRLYFIGQGVSLIGTWMQQVAMSWLVYRLTGSALLLGTVGFMTQIPAFIVAPVAGVLADRVDRRRMLFITQGLSMAEALLLAALTLTGHIQVWHIMVLSLFLGIVNAVDIPVRQSFLLDMVENRADLGNAIALQSSLFNSSRLVGPSLAGLLIARVGEGVCFLVNAASYGAILYALLAMRLTCAPRARADTRILDGLKEGFTYTFGFLPTRSILVFLGVMSLMGSPFVVLLPIFARDILGGGPGTLGFLTTGIGIGALGAAGYLASRPSVRGLSRVIVYASLLFSAALIVFAFSRNLWLSWLMLLTAGFGMMAHMASSNTILQTLADDDKRGRVMSFYTVSIMGAAPLGSLMAGWVASSIGAPNAVALGGVCCLIGTGLFIRHLPQVKKEIRPIYMRKGIIPEVATGIRTATELVTPPKE